MGDRRPRLATGRGLQGAAPGTKGGPTCAGGAGTSPKVAPARAREVTSRARQPEGGPARAGGGASSGRVRPQGEGQRLGGGATGLGPPRTSARRGRLFIFIRRVRGGAWIPATPRPRAADPSPAEAPAPVGRPRLPPPGGSFHLVTTQKCVAPAPPPPRFCSGRGVSSLGRQRGGARRGAAPPSCDRSIGMQQTLPFLLSSNLAGVITVILI